MEVFQRAAARGHNDDVEYGDEAAVAATATTSSRSSSAVPHGDSATAAGSSSAAAAPFFYLPPGLPPDLEALAAKMFALEQLVSACRAGDEAAALRALEEVRRRPSSPLSLCCCC